MACVAVDLQSGVSVHELLQSQRGWELQTDSGRQNQVFDAVGVAVPAPQAISLLGHHGRAFRHLTDVKMAPCWGAMTRGAGSNARMLAIARRSAPLLGM